MAVGDTGCMGEGPGRTERVATLVAWTSAAVVVVISVLAAAVSATDSSSATPWKQIVVAGTWAVPGALIAAGRPRIAVGWLILGVALLFVGTVASDQWMQRATARGTQAGVDWAIWFTDRFSAVLVILTFLALILLPDGALPSRRWRPVVLCIVAVQSVTVAAWALVSGPAAAPDSELSPTLTRLENPLGILPSAVGESVYGLDILVLQLPLLLCPVAFAVRLRRAKGDERARVGLILLAVTAFVLLLVVGRALWPAAAHLLDIAGAILLATVLAAAVLRRWLRGVDVVVHHTVAFGLLTLLIAGLYVLTVAVAASFGEELPAFGSGIVAAVFALCVLPLRERLQRLMNRLLYGDRRQPYEALQRLAERTHDASSLEAVLSELATTVAASLRVPWARVEVEGAAVEAGARPHVAEVRSTELFWGGQRMGTISVAAGAGRSFRDEDVALLDDLGRHGGVAVQAVVLAEAVVASRQRLVVAREEERRQIRRDLHDQLGPTMASIAMQLGALRGIVHSDPDRLAEQLIRLERVAQKSLEDVRRVARELRPPALDEVGLAAGLRQLANGLGITLHIEEVEVPRLPAAVEVAAYRIGAEALTNVARHANASEAELSLLVAVDTMVLEVRDKGPGLNGTGSPGVGILAMRERAEELGGSVFVASLPGQGVTVTATLPLTPSSLGCHP